eukprot:CAMPEP_0201556286 /NCGR_PEP_ID=MMETSP0173_2-20130828/54408_1 /ASSEMBLY_ACC=CAM_ASM_000268 /TAXON_ID=218659 /ORGANISM="Vexillifera sp., Strain DIVA3 564/2" /LENGTH=301 /DNA_ID=CAMNT_0047968485 /DNA_START=49 /DNA_END=954 /DNA_ORIENTATION=+
MVTALKFNFGDHFAALRSIGATQGDHLVQDSDRASTSNSKNTSSDTLAEDQKRLLGSRINNIRRAAAIKVVETCQVSQGHLTKIGRFLQARRFIFWRYLCAADNNDVPPGTTVFEAHLAYSNPSSTQEKLSFLNDFVDSMQIIVEFLQSCMDQQYVKADEMTFFTPVYQMLSVADKQHTILEFVVGPDKPIDTGEEETISVDVLRNLIAEQTDETKQCVKKFATTIKNFLIELNSVRYIKAINQQAGGRDESVKQQVVPKRKRKSMFLNKDWIKALSASSSSGSKQQSKRSGSKLIGSSRS